MGSKWLVLNGKNETLGEYETEAQAKAAALASRERGEWATWHYCD